MGTCSIKQVETSENQSSDDSSSDLEPIEMMKLYEPKPNEPKDIVYSKDMIKAIFLNEYQKQNSILKNI
jgi:hypothetical protein